MPTDRQHRLQEALDGLVQHPGVTGAVLVTRDGFCVVNRCARLSAPETFSAMSATMLAAAEAALAELGSAERTTVVVQAGKTRLVVAGATDELLLVTVSEPSADLADVLPRVASAAETVGKLAAG